MSYILQMCRYKNIGSSSGNYKGGVNESGDSKTNEDMVS
jgi:hypothetical protein